MAITYRLYEIRNNENAETLKSGIGGYNLFKNNRITIDGKPYYLIHVSESKSRIIFEVIDDVNRCQ